MTRAISIDAPPEVVWPWIAQMGRGAGWYSHEVADNGGKTSARHIVSWVPPPSVGDATATGWLRCLEPGRGMTWWLPGTVSLGTNMRMVVDIALRPEGEGSRLVIRISGDADGPLARALMLGFEAVDSIMAIRQLRGLEQRAESFGVRSIDPDDPETGAVDQYQLYEVVYASGETAGVPGREKGALWRDDAIASGAPAPMAESPVTSAGP